MCMFSCVTCCSGGPKFRPFIYTSNQCFLNCCFLACVCFSLFEGCNCNDRPFICRCMCIRCIHVCHTNAKALSKLGINCIVFFCLYFVLEGVMFWSFFTLISMKPCLQFGSTSKLFSLYTAFLTLTLTYTLRPVQHTFTFFTEIIWLAKRIQSIWLADPVFSLF